MKTAALLACSALTAPDLPMGLCLREEPTIASVARAFEEFKAANDARLGDIEKRGSADVLVEEKTKRINDAITALQGDLEKRAAQRDADQKRIDELEARLQRGGAPGKGEETPEQRAYRGDFL